MPCSIYFIPSRSLNRRALSAMGLLPEIFDLTSGKTVTVIAASTRDWQLGSAKLRARGASGLLVAEYVAHALSSSIPKSAFPTKPPRRIVATRLTQRNKRQIKGSDVPPVKIPKPERVCRECGKGRQGDSVHCKKCDLQIATRRFAEVVRTGRAAGYTPEAIAKEAATHRKHAEARCRWKPSDQPAWLTEQMFFGENSTCTRRNLSYGNCKSDWSISLVRGSHSRRLPTASEALADSSCVDQIMPRNLKKRPLDYEGRFCGKHLHFLIRYCQDAERHSERI